MATEQTPLLKNSDEEERPNRTQTEGVASAANDVIPAEPTPAGQNVYTILPVLFLGVIISNLDETIVLASGNTIASEFDALAKGGWLLTSYSLAICSVQPSYGRFSEELGRKFMLLSCYILFMLGCLLSTVGQSFFMVIAGRVVSGLGAAGMNSLALIVIADMVPKRQVSNWRAAFSFSGTIGRSLGGPLGGLFTDTTSWRWSFGIQIPLMAIGALLVLWRLPSQSHQKNVDEDATPLLARLARIDYPGAILISGTIVSFLSMLILVSNSTSSTKYWIAGLALASLVLGVAFVLVERRRGESAIYPLRLFRNRDITTAYFLVALQYGAQYAVTFSIPLYYQITRDVNAKTAGLYLVPTIFGSSIGSFTCGIVMYRTGRYKFLTVSAALAACIGYILIIIRWQGHDSLWELGYSMFGAFGQAAISSTAFQHLTTGLPPSDFAIGGTGLFTSHNIGASAGISIVTAVLRHSLVEQLNAKLPDIDNKAEIIARSAESLSYVRQLTGEVRETVVGSYIRSLTYMHGVSLVFMILALGFATLLREHKF